MFRKKVEPKTLQTKDKHLSRDDYLHSTKLQLWLIISGKEILVYHPFRYFRFLLLFPLDRSEFFPGSIETVFSIDLLLT